MAGPCKEPTAAELERLLEAAAHIKASGDAPLTIENLALVSGMGKHKVAWARRILMDQGKWPYGIPSQRPHGREKPPPPLAPLPGVTPSKRTGQSSEAEVARVERRKRRMRQIKRLQMMPQYRKPGTIINAGVGDKLPESQRRAKTIHHYRGPAFQ